MLDGVEILIVGIFGLVVFACVVLCCSPLCRTCRDIC